MNNNPFNFKNTRSNVPSSIASNLPIQNFNKTYIESWVSNLNREVDDNRLLFKHYVDPSNPNIFYVILEIDNDKVLNIFRAESYNNIVWQYGLSNEFMNYILKKGKSYFYGIMKNYYEIVEIQMNMYLYYLKNNYSLSGMMNIIFIYNFFIKNNIAQNIITQFMCFVKDIKIEDTTKYNSKNNIYLYFMSLILKNIIEKTKKQNSDTFIFSIDYDLEFYFYFFCMDNQYFTQKFKSDLTLDKLKNTFFSGKNQEFINREQITERILTEIVRGVSIKVQNNLLNENEINKLDINQDKLLILKSIIDSGIRFSNMSEINYLLIGGTDTYLFRDRKNIASYINLNIEKGEAISVLEQQIIEIENNNYIGTLKSSLNINLKNNKIITTYEFIGVDKDFLLSNLKTYDISSNNIPYPITIIEPKNSNSTHEIIEYGQYILTPTPQPKILVFNFDEACEELLTDSFYVSTEKKTKKEIQQKVINDFIQNITKIKPAIVVVCTRNSISKTDKHYQHSIKDKILKLDQNNFNYFPLLKVDSTLQSNVRSVKLIGKTLCGIRTRVYVDQNQLLFKYRKKGLESYYGKGNELENTYEQNNSVIRVLDSKNKNNKNIFSHRTTTKIGSIIKYGAKRITDASNKNKGSIIINLVLELTDKTKKQFIFCNYLPNTKIPSTSNFVANNSSNQPKIPDDKNIYICFLSNKISNQNI